MMMLIGLRARFAVCLRGCTAWTTTEKAGMSKALLGFAGLAITHPQVSQDFLVSLVSRAAVGKDGSKRLARINQIRNLAAGHCQNFRTKYN